MAACGRQHRRASFRVAAILVAAAPAGDPFPDERLTGEDTYEWQSGQYLVTRTDVALGFLAGRDGKPVPKGGGPPKFDSNDQVQSWRYHVEIFTEMTAGKYDEDVATKRHNARSLGCWDAGGYTPDLCCSNGGWDECWVEPFSYDSCCSGWSLQKDDEVLERVRLAFSEATSVLSMLAGEGKPYSAFYPHPLLHSVLLQGYAVASKGQPLVISEVGVDEGTYAFHMLGELQRREVPVERFYAIDPWEGAIRGLTEGQLHEPFEAAMQTLMPFWPQPRIIQERGDLAARLVDDHSVDFVFIDAVHTYAYVTLHLEVWWPKLKPGGLIGGHDYAQEKSGRFPGPVLAAQAFARRRGLERVLFGLPGTSFLIFKPHGGE